MIKIKNIFKKKGCNNCKDENGKMYIKGKNAFYRVKYCPFCGRKLY